MNLSHSACVPECDLKNFSFLPPLSNSALQICDRSFVFPHPRHTQRSDLLRWDEISSKRKEAHFVSHGPSMSSTFAFLKQMVIIQVKRGLQSTQQWYCTQMTQGYHTPALNFHLKGRAWARAKEKKLPFGIASSGEEREWFTNSICHAMAARAAAWRVVGGPGTGLG